MSIIVNCIGEERRFINYCDSSTKCCFFWRAQRKLSVMEAAICREAMDSQNDPNYIS